MRAVTRREIHVVILMLGVGVCIGALIGANAPFSRTDFWLGAGLLIAALGLHGLWKTDPR